MHVLNPGQILMATVAGGPGRQRGRQIALLRLQDVAGRALSRRPARPVKWIGGKTFGQYLLFTRDRRKEKQFAFFARHNPVSFERFHFHAVGAELKTKKIVVHLVC